MPHEAAAQPAPDTFQITAVFELPLTTAENCCRPLCAMVETAGAIVSPMVAAVPSVTPAPPDCVGPGRPATTTIAAPASGAADDGDNTDDAMPMLSQTDAMSTISVIFSASFIFRLSRLHRPFAFEPRATQS